VGLVLFSAPPAGDASLRGNVFGFVAMLLWTGYVVSTRAFRREMDVATFMATVSAIAAVAVLPLAVANGGMFTMSGTGWAYTPLLSLLSGMAAQGLLVFAQKSIEIGTIGIAEEVQPALAVVWSLLLLGGDTSVRPGGWHHRRGRRAVGVHRPEPAGCAAGQNGSRPARESQRCSLTATGCPEPRGPPSNQLTVVLARAARASRRSRSVMKCAAAAILRSASSQSACARARLPASAANLARPSRANTSEGAS
jgi:hypothetical protein